MRFLTWLVISFKIGHWRKRRSGIVLDMQSLRCLWVIWLEMSNRQAEIWVWSLGESSPME